MPFDESKDLVSILFQAKDRPSAEILSPYVSSGLKDTLYSLRDKLATGIHVFKSQKLVAYDAETGAQSWKNDITVHAVDPDPTVSAAVIQSNVQHAQFGTSVSASINEANTNALKTMDVPGNMPSEKIDVEKPIEVGFAASLVSALNVNA